MEAGREGGKWKVREGGGEDCRQEMLKLQVDRAVRRITKHFNP